MSLYKVVLIDDERLIREGIAKTFNWAGYGLQLLGTAKNGKEGFELIEEVSPHIVITDIKMPFMDGLQLIEKCATHFRSIRFIVLSGYGEFQFAVKAMQYGVKHYLQKPCNDTEIANALLRIIEEIEVEQESQQERVEASQDSLSMNVMSYSPPVQQVIQIVQEHIADEQLSLQVIAQEYLFMNADYISRLFKKEMGVKFTHYLIQERVKLVKTVIRKNVHSKVYEIAAQTGFGTNTQHLGHVFKANTGSTLTEYKKRLLDSPND